MYVFSAAQARCPTSTVGRGPARTPDRARLALDRIGTIIEVDRATPLFFEGDVAKYRYRVVHGATRNLHLLADGRRHIGAFGLVGDFIGVATGDHYAFTAEAIVDTNLVRHKRAKVDALAVEDPAVAKLLIEIMRRNLAMVHKRMTMASHMTAVERIASFLLELVDRSKTDSIELPMSRIDIGDHLGLTMETVSRTLTGLKTRGIISEQSSHKIMVANPDALEELLQAA